jgi:hypothetical protein
MTRFTTFVCSGVNDLLLASPPSFVEDPEVPPALEDPCPGRWCVPLALGCVSAPVALVAEDVASFDGVDVDVAPEVISFSRDAVKLVASDDGDKLDDLRAHLRATE